MLSHYLSDIISFEDIKNWKGKFVYIKAGTNAGKTYFTTHKLYDYHLENGGRILLVQPRTTLKKQSRNKVIKKNLQKIIEVVTYQKLEYKADNGTLESYLQQFETIVCDEFQYFLSDSAINQFTQISFDALVKSGKTILLLSATGEKMADYITSRCNIDLITVEFEGLHREIQNMYYYEDDAGLDQIIDMAITKGNKLLVFVNDIKKGIALYERHPKHSAFYCSKSNIKNRKYLEYIDEEEYNNIVHNERFEKTVYICTKAFDVGINIKDDSVNEIVIDGITDIDEIIQCVGRKRITHDGQRVALYVRNIENTRLRAYMSREKRLINIVKKLVNEGRAAYLKELKRQRFREPQDFIYEIEDDTEKHVNYLRLYHAECQYENLRKMTSIKQTGYLQVIMETFDIKKLVWWDSDEDNDLLEYLESLALSDNPKRKKENNLKWLLDDDAKREFIERLNLNRRHKLIEGQKVKFVNAFIRDQKGFPYEVIQRETCRRINGKKKKYKIAWAVIRKPCSKR